MNIDKNLPLEKNKKFTIPEEGSLGLLALGDVGLIAWRKEKERQKSQQK